MSASVSATTSASTTLPPLLTIVSSIDTSNEHQVNSTAPPAVEKTVYGWQKRRRSYDIYLGCELVDVEADPRDGLGGLLRLGIPPLLDEPPGLHLGVLDHGNLGSVPDADHVEELPGVALPVLVEHLLVL
jgi:hypothetical protein